MMWDKLWRATKSSGVDNKSRFTGRIANASDAMPEL